MTKLLFMLILRITIVIIIIIIIISNNKLIHPIFMGLILLLTTILSSMNLRSYIRNHWFSFIIFLILVGGLIILFLYFVSFNNNIKMSIKWYFLINIPVKFSLTMLFVIFILLNLNNILWIINNEEIYFILNNSLKFNLTYLYLRGKNISSILVIIYLLITLSLIVKICIRKKLKLRKIN